MRASLVIIIFTCLLGRVWASSEKYVGSQACADCHEEQFERYHKYSKKAHSGRSVKIMKSDLSSEEVAKCYECHTTGYGQPGGFVSFEQTPEMANAGCEVCHGPGFEHVQSEGDPELIKGSLNMKDCETCHNEQRVASFDFKPLLYSGAH